MLERSIEAAGRAERLRRREAIVIAVYACMWCSRRSREGFEDGGT